MNSVGKMKAVIIRRRDVAQIANQMNGDLHPTQLITQSIVGETVISKVV